MPLGSLLPIDSGGHYFSGAGEYKTQATRVGSTDYAVPHVLLVDANDHPLLVASTTLVDSYQNATTASSLMLAANSAARYRFFQNPSAVDIYLRFGATAVGNTGLWLPPNGGAYEMSVLAGNLDTRAVNGITNAGAGTLLMLEG